MIPEALATVLTNDTEEVTSFFDEVDKRNRAYDTIEETISKDKELAAILNSPAYTEEQKREIASGVTKEVLKELGYEPVTVKLISTTEPGRDGKQIKGYYSEETRGSNKQGLNEHQSGIHATNSSKKVFPDN